jgi:hypothetical protein
VLGHSKGCTTLFFSNLSWCARLNDTGVNIYGCVTTVLTVYLTQYTLVAVLTMYLTQYAPLRGEPNRSGALREKRKKIEKNVKFQAKF